jgi:hypothetical protein
MSGEQKINSIRSTKDGVETSVSMEEIENGFVITVYKNWQDKKEGYKSETKKYFSETNPLKKLSIDEDIIKNALENSFE